MKKSAFIVMGAALLALASCDNRPDIVGEWQGTVKDAIPGTTTSNITANYAFQRDGSTMAAYEFEFSEAVQPNGQIVSPYQMNIAGTASVQGRWQYVDREDDEVAITYDMSTLQVKIDPDAVVLQENVFSDEQKPMVDSLKTAAQQKYAQLLTSYLKQTPNVVWDDVKVKKPLLKYEVGHTKHVLQEVMAQ